MSSARNTLVRSLHDVGAAAWFGGSLMGAVGLNGGAGVADDPTERAAIAADGWARWSPVAAGAIGAHLVGGLGLLLANRERATNLPGVRVNTGVKTALTAAALGTTAWSGLLGRRLGQMEDEPARSATDPSPRASREFRTTQKQLRTLQWVTPALTGVIVVLAAQQGEQQRPSQELSGRAARVARRVRR